jgi:secondary thiamine-phosphate synthase enzyme
MELATVTRPKPYTRLRITTAQPVQFIDITDEASRVVGESGVRTGIINVQSLHTTVAIILNEHEPLLLGDFAALLERTAPLGIAYYHDNLDVRTVNVGPGERFNGHAHCRALLLGSSVCLNVVDGELQLGRWQRLLMIELDGPQARDVSIVVAGDIRQ